MTDGVLRDHIEDLRRLRYLKLWSLKRIAEKYGVSKERVRQLVPNNGRKIQRARTRTRVSFIRSQVDKTNAELAKELGLCHGSISAARGDIRHAVESDCSTGIGDTWEKVVSDKLSSLGIENELMAFRHPFDILAGMCRIDVKSSERAAKPTNDSFVSPQYRFKVCKGAKRSDTDFYILVTRDTRDYFVIPACEVPRSSAQIQMCWPTLRPEIGKYQKYHNRFDLIKRFIELADEPQKG